MRNVFSSKKPTTTPIEQSQSLRSEISKIKTALLSANEELAGAEAEHVALMARWGDAEADAVLGVGGGENAHADVRVQRDRIERIQIRKSSLLTRLSLRFSDLEVLLPSLGDSEGAICERYRIASLAEVRRCFVSAQAAMERYLAFVEASGSEFPQVFLRYHAQDPESAQELLSVYGGFRANAEAMKLFEEINQQLQPFRAARAALAEAVKSDELAVAK